MVGDVDVDLANARHVRRAADHIQPPLCCSLRPSEWDLLWLLEGLSEDRISVSLWRMISLQGLPGAAIEALTRYEPLLSGHPALEAARAQAAISLGYKSLDDVRENWFKQGTRSAAVAAYWSPGQNYIARQGLLAMGIPSPQSQFMVDAYGYDYPHKPSWPEFFFGDTIEKRSAFALEALEFSSVDISPLSRLPAGDQPGQAGAVLASLGARFTSNPAKPAPTMPAGPSGVPEPQDVIARLRKAIKKDPELWENYWALGTEILQSGGKFGEANKVFLSYPGFHEPSPDDPVAISNYVLSHRRVPLVILCIRSRQEWRSREIGRISG
jgi:hypothetical protein